MATAEASVAADQQRATAAAEAAAHAAEVSLLAAPFAADLALELELRGARCGVRAGAAGGASSPEISGDLGSEASLACGVAVVAAQRQALANDAVVVALEVGPDARDVGRPVAQRLQVVAVAAVGRRAVPPALCRHHPPPDDGRSDLCWAVAAAAAQAQGAQG